MGAASLHYYLVDRQVRVTSVALATLLVALLLLVLAASLNGVTDGVFVADSSSQVSPFRWS